MRLPRALLLALAAASGAVAGLLVPTAESPVRAATTVGLADAFPGVRFTRPLFAAQPPDGTPRMFVAEQGGRIWIVDHPAPEPPATASKRLFLDLSAKVSRVGNEEGLLGFAFHPDFATNRRLFVHYSAKYAADSERRNVLAEVLADADDPDAADVATERSVLEVRQPYSNHNGGWIGFGPDRKLYVALGDGGSGGDPGDRAQDLSSLLGKILRVDVDGGDPYAVPEDNPFVARAGARGEIFAYGLRNPWRCSFDRTTGDLWAGDVGQGTWEEVDRIVAGGNYGWRRREGAHPYDLSGRAPADPPIDPVAEYSHAFGQSVTGGFVHRGAGVPELSGAYLFADFQSGRLWALRDPYGVPTVSLVLDTDESIASFAEDRGGELHLLSFSGRVLALREDGPFEGAVLPPTLSELGLFADLRRLTPRAGALRYDVLSPLWADGAGKARFLVLPGGAAMTWSDSDAFELPVGAYAVKTFSRRGVRLETRVIRRTETGFDAATYRWRSDRSDAIRVDERVTAAAAGGTWTWPSPDDCRLCHTAASGFLLGVRARQIRAGTVARWSHAGVLAGAPDPRTVPRNVPLGVHRGRDVRVRSYLDSNCSSCHRPDDPANASLDLRATTPLEETGVLDLPPQHADLSIADARIVAPGDPPRSTLLGQVRTTGESRMPPLGSSVPDRRAARVIARWIRDLGR